MKSALKLLVVAGLVAFSLTLATFAPTSRTAQADSPYCQAGAPYYNAAQCAQYGGASPYCQTSGAYNPMPCTLYSTSNSAGLYCTPGMASYNPTQCAQYGGSINTSVYCTPGTPGYNPSPCAQYGVNASTSFYCTPGMASYNPTLCAQYGGSTTSGYCQAGASFAPCGVSPAPATSQVTDYCAGYGTASVNFNWGQPTSGYINYLDISLFDNGFAAGTFIGTPVNGLTAYNWTGILANVPTYWRVNSLLTNGWTQTISGSFIAPC